MSIFSAPKQSAPPPPPSPTSTDSDAIAAAAAAERRRNLSAQGRSGTILGGNVGGQSNLNVKQLLGQ